MGSFHELTEDEWAGIQMGIPWEVIAEGNNVTHMPVLTPNEVIEHHKLVDGLPKPNDVPKALDIDTGLDLWTLTELMDGLVVTSHLRKEWKEGDCYCNGCFESVDEDNIYLGYDSLGVGFFCTDCNTKLMAGIPTDAMVSSGPHAEGPIAFAQDNPFVGCTPSQIVKSLSDELQTRPVTEEEISELKLLPKSNQSGNKGSGQKTSYQQQSWQKKYPPKPTCVLGYQNGHQNPISFKGTNGGVIVSSSRNATISPDATAALFFDQSWKSAAVGMKVEFKNNDKGIIPDFKEEVEIPIAFITWPDMKAPHSKIMLYVDWALKFIDNGGWLQIGCIGGHGRTGTFLALLLIKSGRATTAMEAIGMTRALYCDKAVESITQVDFICEITGDEKPKNISDVDVLQPWKEKADAAKAAEEAKKPKPKSTPIASAASTKNQGSKKDNGPVPTRNNRRPATYSVGPGGKKKEKEATS